MLIVKKFTKGVCLWCASEKDGVEVEMQNGSLRGFLCNCTLGDLGR